MKRFWTAAAAVPYDGGFRIELDGRSVKTPAKQSLQVPGQALADAIAAEWDAQGEKVDPDAMPLTRLANSALDKVSVQHADVANLIAEYAGSDLLCYRAEGPAALVARQAQAWDSLLHWAARDLGVTLRVQTGVMPVTQPDASLTRAHALTHAMDPFTLTAFHELVSISGSWVIGMAALAESVELDTLWTAACLDELFQAQQWGDDDEALKMRAAKRAAFMSANKFWQLNGKVDVTGRQKP